MILLCNKLPLTFIGGVERVAAQYVDVLQNYERVYVLSYGLDKELRITRSRKTVEIEVPPWFRLGSYSFSFLYLFLVFRLAKKADKISLHMPFPITAEVVGLIWPKKTIATWHATIPRISLLTKLINKTHSIVLGRVKKIIFTSEYYEKLYHEITKDCCVIPLWLDNDVLPADTIAKNQPKFALFLGRFGRYKGLDVLALAMQDPRLSSIQVKIVGEGAFLPDQLRVLPNVSVADSFVSETEKRALFRSCHLFLFPSTDEGEAFGITQLEAMRDGKPVINTKLESGVPFVSQNFVSGITVPPGNAELLADAIYQLWNDDALYSKLSTGATERYIRLFKADESREKLAKIFGG